MAKKTTIRCPKCGREYLPGEIYYPEEFLGQPKNIIKDEAGNVLGFEGSDMNTVEEYVCDACGAKFTVDASITFRTAEVVDDFDDEYVSPIKLG